MPVIKLIPIATHSKSDEFISEPILFAELPTDSEQRIRQATFGRVWQVNGILQEKEG